MFNLVVIRNQTTYESFYPKINDYLTRTETIIPEITLDPLLNDKAKEAVENRWIHEKGTWEFTFDLQHDPGTFAFYHFEMDIANDEDFNDIIISRDSFISVTGWFFEEELGSFEPMNFNGVTSNHVGLRVRYESQEGEKLERGRHFYFRVRQKDQLTTFGYRIFREVIYR